MPLQKGTRYRYRKTRKGKQRLAFLNGKVIEVKGYKRNGKKVRGYIKKIK